jgi:hypothetical protein
MAVPRKGYPRSQSARCINSEDKGLVQRETVKQAKRRELALPPGGLAFSRGGDACAAINDS